MIADLCAQGRVANSPLACLRARAKVLCVPVPALLQVQAHRASLYSQFQAGFKAYMECGAEGPYKRLLQQLTAQFSAVSQQVGQQIQGEKVAVLQCMVM
jgi:hypothetical protein